MRMNMNIMQKERDDVISLLKYTFKVKEALGGDKGPLEADIYFDTRDFSIR